MKASQKIAQYLAEARATEDALIRVLQSQIAMTPRGTYRSGLETHLEETRRHSAQVGDRLSAVGGGGSALGAVVGVVEDLAGQALALGKTPLDLLRGSGGEEKVLKNAKDACATEALEIATYTALESLARAVGDDETADLAAAIRADEERMLERVLGEIPQLTEAVVRADLRGLPSYDVRRTGAADTVREAADTVREAAVAVTEPPAPAIARYDQLTAEQIVAKLPQLSQSELATIDSYERANENRTTILGRVESLRGDEPWPGYDELTAPEVLSEISSDDSDQLGRVRTYERSHKNRAGVLKAVERGLASA